MNKTYNINTRNILCTAILALLAVIFAGSIYMKAHAQSTGATRLEESPAEPMEDKTDLQNTLEEKRDTVLQRKQDVVEDLREKRDDLRNTAQDVREVSQDKRQDIRNSIQDNGATAKERVQEKREERKEKLNDLAKKRIGAYVERILRRLNAALDRMDRISERIENRIEKLEETGHDLTDARSLLNSAKALISQGWDDIAAIETSIDDALNFENPRESFSVIREFIGEAKDSVKNAHKALVEAIRAVKAGISTRADTSMPASADTSDEEDDE
jgi:chromosome segregation ATPase